MGEFLKKCEKWQIINSGISNIKKEMSNFERKLNF